MRKWTPVPNHPNVFSYPTSKGTRYGVRRSYQKSVGTRDEFNKSGFKDWRSAEARLKTFEADYALGKYDELAAGRTTLDQAWNHLVEVRHETGKWRPTTETSQTNWYTMYLQPALGKKKLSELRKATVRPVLNKLAANGMAHATIRSILGTLTAILNLAIQDDLLDKNRIRGIEYNGKNPKKKMEDPITTQKWLDVARNTLTPYDFAMVLTMAKTGMRSGEVTGLRAHSITFRRDEIHNLDYAVIKVDKQRSVHYPTGGPLKTRQSYRSIIALGELVDCLKLALTARKARYDKAHRNPPKDDEDWLWLQENGELSSSTHLRYLCLKVEEKAGVHINPHMFRHYFASLAIASGKPDIDVMHSLGHGSVQMTADYTRPTEQAILEVAKGFEEQTLQADAEIERSTEKASGTKNSVPHDVPHPQTN